MAKQAGHDDNAMKKVLKISNSQVQCYRANTKISFLFPLKQYIQQCTPSTCMDSKLEVFCQNWKNSWKKMQSASYNLFWMQRIEIFKGAQPVWVYLLGSQANPELRGNSAVAYKYIADYTLGEMKSFSWICLCWKLEGYSVLTAMMLWNNLSLEKWGKAIQVASWLAAGTILWLSVTRNDSVWVCAWDPFQNMPLLVTVGTLDAECFGKSWFHCLSESEQRPFINIHWHGALQTSFSCGTNMGHSGR